MSLNEMERKLEQGDGMRLAGEKKIRMYGEKNEKNIKWKRDETFWEIL